VNAFKQYNCQIVSSGLKTTAVNYDHALNLITHKVAGTD